MKKLYEKKAVLHSIVWLAFYFILNTVTGNIAGEMKMDPNMVSAIPNLALAIICFIYLQRTGISKNIGLFTKPDEKSSMMLFYIPLLILPFLNLFYGINTSFQAPQILLILAMFIGVGFMEEIIFRGLMFKALKMKWNRYIIVAFISLTFAFGHIVSMAAIGQSGSDTVLQIINAFIVGFMFMAVILASGNLTICIITHILYNFIATISLINNTQTEIIAVNAVITAAYFIYLLACPKNIKAYFSSKDSLIR